MVADSRTSADAFFEVTHDAEPTETLLAGFSNFGLAGLTAVDYLINHLELEQTGHITAEQLPSITPFQGGRPRHHTRLFSRDDLDITVLIGELFVPLWAAQSFSNAIHDWVEANDTTEIAVLSGVPIQHGPDEHRVFYVATDDYRESRLADADIPPMGTGFLDGVNANLMARGMDSSLAVGLFITPVHAQVPDIEAALRLLDGIESVYGLDIDTGPLEEFAGDVREYYARLSERLQTVDEDHRPEDRMYM